MVLLRKNLHSETFNPYKIVLQSCVRFFDSFCPNEGIMLHNTIADHSDLILGSCLGWTLMGMGRSVLMSWQLSISMATGKYQRLHKKQKCIAIIGNFSFALWRLSSERPWALCWVSALTVSRTPWWTWWWGRRGTRTGTISSPCRRSTQLRGD